MLIVKSIDSPIMLRTTRVPDIVNKSFRGLRSRLENRVNRQESRAHQALSSSLTKPRSRSVACLCEGLVKFMFKPPDQQDFGSVPSKATVPSGFDDD
jgi:hypothetical protein